MGNLWFLHQQNGLRISSMGGGWEDTEGYGRRTISWCLTERTTFPLLLLQLNLWWRRGAAGIEDGKSLIETRRISLIYIWKILLVGYIHTRLNFSFFSIYNIYWKVTWPYPTRIKMQQGSRCNEDKDATRIKMQRGSRWIEDKDATRIKMQRGSRCNEDQDATRIKMQQGSRCN